MQMGPMHFWLFLFISRGVWRTVSPDSFGYFLNEESLMEQGSEVLKQLQTLRGQELAQLHAVQEIGNGLSQRLRLRRNLSGTALQTIALRLDRSRHFNERRQTSRLRTVKSSDNPEDGCQENILTSLKSYQSNKHRPTKRDIAAAASALLRIQTSYKIDAMDLARCHVAGLRRTPTFTAREAFQMGYSLAVSKKFRRAVQWLEVAAQTHAKEGEKTTSYSEILDWLQLSTWNVNRNASKALKIAQMIKEISPDYTSIDDTIRGYEEHLVSLNADQLRQLDLPELTDGDPEEDEIFHKLCRGEQQLGKQALLQQKCYFETYGNSLLLFQPIKTEILHVNPDIFHLHEVLLESQLAYFRQAAHENLRYSKASQGLPIMQRDYQKARGVYLNDTSDKVLQDINRRMGLAANLNPQFSDLIHVRHFPVGGSYIMHTDTNRKLGDPHQLPNGPYVDEHLASFVLHSTDVEAGGRLVFPQLGLACTPRKGSALFFHNLHRDGQIDARSTHCACPVASGSSLQLSKFFLERGQDATRPCDLTKDSQSD